MGLTTSGPAGRKKTCIVRTLSPSMDRRHPYRHFRTVPRHIEDPLTVQAALSMDAYNFENLPHISQLSAQYRKISLHFQALS